MQKQRWYRQTSMNLEVKLNPVIFIDQGQGENISNCPKMPKNIDFRRFNWLLNLNFLATHQIDELNVQKCSDVMSITSMWSRGSIRVDTDRHRWIRVEFKPDDFYWLMEVENISSCSKMLKNSILDDLHGLRNTKFLNTHRILERKVKKCYWFFVNQFYVN